MENFKFPGDIPYFSGLGYFSLFTVYRCLEWQVCVQHRYWDKWFIKVFWLETLGLWLGVAETQLRWGFRHLWNYCAYADMTCQRDDTCGCNHKPFLHHPSTQRKWFPRLAQHTLTNNGPSRCVSPLHWRHRKISWGNSTFPVVYSTKINHEKFLCILTVSYCQKLYEKLYER